MTANKRRAIRNTLDRLGMQAKPEQVVEALEIVGSLARTVAIPKSVRCDGHQAGKSQTQA